MRRKKKEHLIPKEKVDHIIYLEKRGRGGHMTACTLVFAILAVLCLVYCLAIGLFMGYGTRFFLVWGILAVVCGGIALLLYHREWLDRIPLWLRTVVVVCFVAGVLLFVTIEGLILSRFGATAQPSADYMIILGAQWKQSGPSLVLRKRLDTALIYLNENPDTYVIVSGGQGANEPVSEAEGMKGYLMEAGIAEERILLEKVSSNTNENLQYSSIFLEKEQDRVVVVTNNFHMFRAERIARKQGYSKVEGLAAPSHMGMLMNNLLREFLGVMKDFAVGNL